MGITVSNKNKHTLSSYTSIQQFDKGCRQEFRPQARIAWAIKDSGHYIYIAKEIQIAQCAERCYISYLPQKVAPEVELLVPGEHGWQPLERTAETFPSVDQKPGWHSVPYQKSIKPSRTLFLIESFWWYLKHGTVQHCLVIWPFRVFLRHRRDFDSINHWLDDAETQNNRRHKLKPKCSTCVLLPPSEFTLKSPSSSSPYILATASLS